MRMAHLVLTGQIKNKKRVVEYANALAKELGLGRMWSKIIFIKFKTTLDDEVQGQCWGSRADGYAEVKIARKSGGEPLDYDEMMRTLAHEMVHAKQYLRGEINAAGGWKGKKPRNYKYENQPWEKEAYSKEVGLYEKCWL
tara:strand:- start:1705 stop:2124 length:420 start_codon:yes stop_codon:yes gene_type:complete